MNTPIDHDATAHDADTLALALEGKKHLQRQARAIAAAMRKQEKRIKELEDHLSDVLAAFNGCQCGVDPDDTWHKAAALFPQVTK